MSLQGSNRYVSSTYRYWPHGDGKDWLYVEKSPRYEKGENLNTSTDELPASHTNPRGFGVTYCLAASCKHMACVAFSSSAKEDS